MRSFLLLMSMILMLIGGAGCSKSKSKVYQVAIDQSWYPLDLIGKGAAVFAFSDDLLMSIAEDEDLVIQVYPVSWDSLLSSLNQGRADGAMSSNLPVAQYQDLYSFSEPYLLLGPVLVTRASSNYTSLGDLSDKEVGVLTGATTVLLAEQNPAILIRYFEKYTTALDQLTAGTIDGLIMPRLLADAYVKDIYSGSLKIATPPLNNDGLRLMTLKDKNQELLDSFDEGLKKLKDNGTYDQLLKKWNILS